MDQLPPDVALFSESPGRFLITVAAADANRLERLFEGHPCRRAGRVAGDGRLRVRWGAAVRVDLEAQALLDAFKETLADE